MASPWHAALARAAGGCGGERERHDRTGLCGRPASRHPEKGPADARTEGYRVACSMPSDPLATFGVHHAEQIPFCVSEHYEVGAIGVHPVHAPGTERYQPLDFGLLILFTCYVQVEMGTVGLDQQECWALDARGHEGAWVVARTRNVVKRVAPEVCCSVDVGDVQHQ